MVAKRGALTCAALAALLALAAGEYGTRPTELATLRAFKAVMEARPARLWEDPETKQTYEVQKWRDALAGWTCPTPADNSFSPEVTGAADAGACDPCGKLVWGNWEHVACRGPPLTPTTYRTGGDGYVTTVHITDYSPLGGPVPLAELCPLSRLREFDIDGAGLEGPLPGGFGACFPELRELDLSYNELTGEIPAEITDAKSLQEFKVDYNRLTGELPAGLGGMPKIQWLRFSENKLSGKLPADLAGSARTLLQLQLHNNAFEGDLYALKGHSFVSFTAHGNAGLCGMVPLGARYAHGFSFWGTSLGLPCPGELESGIDA